VLFLPEAARFSRLLAQPEGADIGQAINDAMRAIEAENEALRDVLPKTYNRLDNRTLFALLKNFNSVPMDIEGAEDDVGCPHMHLHGWAASLAETRPESLGAEPVPRRRDGDRVRGGVSAWRMLLGRQPAASMRRL
jgi:hypothetical protein